MSEDKGKGGAAPAPAAAATPAAPAAKDKDAKPADPKAAAQKPGDKPAAEPAAKASDFARFQEQIKAGENKLKSERAALDAERAAWAKEKDTAIKGASDAALERMRERVKKGEYDEALAEIGVDYVAWSKQRLAKMGKTAPGAAPQAQDVGKLVSEQVAAELARRDEEAKKSATAQAEKAWTDSWTGVASDLSKKPEGYELLSHAFETDPGHVESVFKEIARRQPGITAKDAADRYEAWLLDRQREVMQLGKVKALYAPKTKQPDTARPGAEAGQIANEGGPRTLTNADAAEASGNAGTPSRALTRPEQIMLEREEEKRRDGRAVGRLNQG